MMMMGW